MLFVSLAVISPSVVQSSLLGHLNQRQVLRAIRASGPLSRAEVARLSGISPPTASKAVEALLRAGLLEEGEASEAGRGRPARKLRLASERAQVLGIVLDAGLCRVVGGSLDGNLREAESATFRTPDTYESLLETLTQHCRRCLTRRGVRTLGIGISIPGLVDYRSQRGVLSPNLPLTNGRTPGTDLAERLGVDCVLIQESHALCLAEYHFGDAQGTDDFAMLDVATGVGLGVMSGGRPLAGHRGLAGEIGHVTLDPDGQVCGCGNRGCLETLACDAALARSLSIRLGRVLDFDAVLELAALGLEPLQPELDRTLRYLAIGAAAVLNLFNPSTLYIHGRLFELGPDLFEQLVAETRRRALTPSFESCRIVQARGSKRQGAIAAIIEHLTDARVPVVLPPGSGGVLSNGNGNGAVATA